MKNTPKQFKSKLLISTIKVPFAKPDKSYYLSITVNENKTFKTKKLDLKKYNIYNINQIFELEGILIIDTIKFQIFEKNAIFSNGLYKGEVNKNNKLRCELTNELICYLSNNNQENCAMVLYNYELNPDLLEEFDAKLKNLEEVQKTKTSQKQKSKFSSLRELASGDNAENFAKFVHNMEYIKTFCKSFDEFRYWKNPWKTTTILLLYSLAIIQIKLFLTLLPLFLIFFHLYNKDKLEQYSHKKTKQDSLENMTLITQSIDITNKTIDYYENFLEAIQHSEKKIFEEIYFNFLKLIFVNWFVLYFNLYSFKFMMMFPIWVICLWSNPPFQAFLIFMNHFIYAKILCHFECNPKVSYILTELENIFLKSVPFLDMIKKYFKVRNEILINQINFDGNTTSRIEKLKISEVLENFDSSKAVLLTNLLLHETNESILNSENDEHLKFEIYENERWWMFAGWTKNLIMNERPTWSDLSGKNYMDTNSVFLPSSEYKWLADWKIELSSFTDSQGWQYSMDFNSTFKVNSIGKYVRKRKWTRYAKKQ